jgi:hypothetical protein
MPDIQYDPFINGGIQQQGSTLTDPYQARVIDFGLGNAYQQYANSSIESIRKRNERETTDFNSVLDGITGIFGAVQQQKALEELQASKSIRAASSAIDQAGGKNFQSFKNYQLGQKNQDVSVKPGESIGTLNALPELKKHTGIAGGIGGINTTQLLSAIKGLPPGVASSIVNHAQQREANALKREQKLSDDEDALAAAKEAAVAAGVNPDLITSPKTSASQLLAYSKQTDKQATLELAGSVGKQLSAEYAAAVSIDEKQAIVAKYSAEPGLKNAVAAYTKLINQDLAQAGVDIRGQGVQNQIQNTQSQISDRQADNTRADAQQQLNASQQTFTQQLQAENLRLNQDKLLLQEQNQRFNQQAPGTNTGATTGTLPRGPSLGLPPAPPQLKGLPPDGPSGIKGAKIIQVPPGAFPRIGPPLAVPAKPASAAQIKAAAKGNAAASGQKASSFVIKTDEKGNQVRIDKITGKSTPITDEKTGAVLKAKQTLGKEEAKIEKLKALGLIPPDAAAATPSKGTGNSGQTKSGVKFTFTVK